MPVDMRPAIPVALPRSTPLIARHRRLLRWLATAVTSITAVLAILLVAAGAVLLGMS
jgi:hypothetical protein